MSAPTDGQVTAAAPRSPRPGALASPTSPQQASLPFLIVTVKDIVYNVGKNDAAAGVPALLDRHRPRCCRPRTASGAGFMN